MPVTVIIIITSHSDRSCWSRATMEEPIWHTVWQILTYQGSNIDIVINYVMCCVALYACLTVDRPPSPIQESRRRPRCTYSAFIIFETVALLLYQVILCIGVHCTGVSIVWSALFGTYCFFDRHRFPALKSLTYVFVTSAVWAYYFATEDGLTTVAHFSAFILGIVIAVAGDRYCLPACHPHQEDILSESTLGK